MQFNDLEFELLWYGENEKIKSPTSYITPSFKLIEEKISSRIMLTLYKSLVRPILKYSSVLWTPITQEDIQRIKEIQQAFLLKVKGI